MVAELAHRVLLTRGKRVPAIDLPASGDASETHQSLCHLLDTTTHRCGGNGD